MKQRERVLTALNHEKPDRAPFQATFTPEFAARLRAELGLAGELTHDPHSGRWNGYELEKATGQDALQCSIGWVTSYYQDTADYTDEWGVKWVCAEYETPFGPGIYTNLKEGPLQADEALASYQPPDPHRGELYENLKRLIAEEKDQYYIMGRCHTTIFETAWALRGMEQFMCDLALDPERARRIIDIPYHYHKVVIEKMVNLGVDMVWLGDDMGAQDNMLISPATWREYFKPLLAELIGFIKELNPQVHVGYHTDGDNRPIIPDLIDIGLDVLNPIQAESMDPAAIKEEFGDRLCFHGAIDVQSTLPFAGPEGVAKEYLERFETIGKNGGWICSPTHHIQLDTPLENMWTLVQAIKDNPYH